MKTDEIQRAIGKLEGTVEAGFRAVNHRLDRINGTVIDHDKRIDDNKSKMDNLLGKISVVGSVGVFIGGLIMAGINYFLRK